MVDLVFLLDGCGGGGGGSCDCFDCVDSSFSNGCKGTSSLFAVLEEESEGIGMESEVKGSIVMIRQKNQLKGKVIY